MAEPVGSLQEIHDIESFETDLGNLAVEEFSAKQTSLLNELKYKAEELDVLKSIAVQPRPFININPPELVFQMQSRSLDHLSYDFQLIPQYIDAITNISGSPIATSVTTCWRDQYIKEFPSEERVYSVSVRHDGRYVLSEGPSDIDVWNTESGARVRKLKGHTSTVGSICISKNDKLVISWS